jgi:hypothetical protein
MIHGLVIAGKPSGEWPGRLIYREARDGLPNGKMSDTLVEAKVPGEGW